MTNYFLLVCALCCNVALALLDKKASCKIEKSQEIPFSFEKTLLCAVFSAVLLPFAGFKTDINGFIISVFAGIFHSLSVVLIMHTLKKTLAVYVNVFMSAGIVLPSLFGMIFFEDELSLLKIISLFLMIFALSMTVNMKYGRQKNAKSLIPMFFCYGMLMVMQNIFPKYSQSGNRIMFSFVMYATSVTVLLFFIKVKSKEKLSAKISGLPLGICIASAIFNVAVNILLTAVSAKISSYIVFPFVHGVKLVFITLMSQILWNEKLKRSQIFGCLLAVLCICVLSL